MASAGSLKREDGMDDIDDIDDLAAMLEAQLDESSGNDGDQANDHAQSHPTGVARPSPEQPKANVAEPRTSPMMSRSKRGRRPGGFGWRSTAPKRSNQSPKRGVSSDTADDGSGQDTDSASDSSEAEAEAEAEAVDHCSPSDAVASDSSMDDFGGEEALHSWNEEWSSDVGKSSSGTVESVEDESSEIHGVEVIVKPPATEVGADVQEEQLVRPKAQGETSHLPMWNSHFARTFWI